jgi:hypothetical protein
MLATVNPVVEAFVEDAKVAKSDVPVAAPNERLVVVAKLDQKLEEDAVFTERVDVGVPVALMKVRLEVDAVVVKRLERVRPVPDAVVKVV